MYAMTAAHPTLPIPSYARIRNPANGREVLVRVNDRGPFVAGRIVDLSYAAAFKLDLLRGVAPVELERITFDEIRTGAWRGGGGGRRARRAAAQAGRRRRRSRSTCGRDVARRRRRRRVPPPARRRQSPAARSHACRRRTSPSRGRAASSLARRCSPRVDCAPRPGRAPAERRAASGSSSARSASATAPRASAAASAPTASRRWLEPLLAIFGDASLYRVQAGPYPSRDEAESVAQRARSALGVVPIVVERR